MFAARAEARHVQISFVHVVQPTASIVTLTYVATGASCQPTADINFQGLHRSAYQQSWALERTKIENQGLTMTLLNSPCSF